MASYFNLPDISVTTGSDQVTINTVVSGVSGFREGDILFTKDVELPLVVKSATNSVITLMALASFTAANTSGMLVMSSIKVREALTFIQENNAAWALHFSPFINWVSTSDAQATMYDTLGNAIQVYSAQGLNDLASDIAAATSDFTVLEGRIDQAEIDLNSIDATLDGKIATAQQAVVDAQAEVALAANQVTLAQAEVTLAQAEVVLAQLEVQTAKDWATSATEVETGLYSAKTYAEQSSTASNISSANANYKGEWASLTGALNVPASAKDGNAVYMLNTNLADVTTSQPSVDTASWFLLGVIGQSTPDSDRLGGELPSYYAKSSDLIITDQYTADLAVKVELAILDSLGVR